MTDRRHLFQTAAGEPGQIGLGVQPGQLPQPDDGRRIVRLTVIYRSGDLGVHARPAQLLAVHHLPDGRPHQRWPREVQPRAFGHDQRVAHHRQVRPARHAVAHDGAQLRNPLRAHPGVQVKDPPEVVLIRENLVLHRQVHARRIDEVHDPQAVFLSDGLRPDHLLGGDGKKGSGLDGGVVGDDHPGPPGDLTDARHHAASRAAARLPVHLVSGEGHQFVEGSAGVDQGGDAFTGGQAALGVLPGRGVRATSCLNLQPVHLQPFKRQCPAFSPGAASAARVDHAGSLSAVRQRASGDR